VEVVRTLSVVLRIAFLIIQVSIRRDDPVRLRGGMDGGPGEALDDAVEPVTPVEPVGEAVR
jgi:hypothetical protein